MKRLLAVSMVILSFGCSLTAQNLLRMGFVMGGDPKESPPPPAVKQGDTERLSAFVIEVGNDGIVCEVRALNWRAPGGFDHVRYILLRHHPKETNVIAGDHLECQARQVGRTTILGETSAIYDCAAQTANPHLKAPSLAEMEHLTTQAEANSRQAETNRLEREAWSLKRDRDSCARGEAFGQCRMAERYQLGLGVAKDMGKALELYRASAAQGNPDAQAMLKTLGDSR